MNALAVVEEFDVIANSLLCVGPGIKFVGIEPLGLYVVSEFNKLYKAKNENVEFEKELRQKLARLQKSRQKYMDMYTDDLISREELNEKISGMRDEIACLENDLKMVELNINKGDQLETIVEKTFSTVESIADVQQMTNAQLKQIIQRIEVDKDGNVDIYLRLLGDLGLDETVMICDFHTIRSL